MSRLAARMARAKPSAIMLMAERAKALKSAGRDIVSFSIGVPNFLPDVHVYAAARKALDHDSGQYGSNRGAPELLDAYLQHLGEMGVHGYQRADLAAGVGAKHLLFQLLYAVLNEGDEILIPTPYWTSYIDIAEILNARIKLVECGPADDYKLTPARLEAAIGPATRMVLFCNPSNPAGVIYTRDEIAALAAVFVRYPALVVSDDLYSRMIFDGVGFHHLVNAEPALRDRVILVDSVSKSFGMPGWRVGLMAGPRDIADAVVTLNSNSITNLPEVAVAAATAALAGSKAKTEQMCALFAQRRDRVVAALAAIPGVHCPYPRGAFYALPDISALYGRRHGDQLITDDLAFCNALLERAGVACVPGSAFGEPRAMRISYALPDAQLDDGLARLQRFASELT